MTKLLNFRLILFVALSYIVGIATVYFIVFSFPFWAITFPLIFIACLSLFIFPFSKKENRIKSLIFSAVFIIFFLLGGINFYVRVENFNRADLGGSYYSVEGKVKSVKETVNGKRYILSNVRVDGKTTGILKYKIALYVSGETDYDIGDVLGFSGRLTDKPIIYEDRFSSYDVADKIKYTASKESGDVTFLGDKRTVFEKVNVFIRESLKKGLSEDNFAIGYAMLTGNDEYMDLEVLSAYRTAGVAHIFAVSGLHIGFIATVLNFLFDKFRINRLVKAVMITLILLFYSGVCGFSASSLRATVMSAILLFAAVKGERYDKYVSVSLAALFVLTLSPVQLFCVGFQLSFTVVTFMLLLAKPLSNLFKFLPYKIASPLGAVIAAQVAGIPISLAAFKEFSLIAIVANLLFIPLVGVIFIALIVGVLLGGLFNIYTVTLFLPNLSLSVVNAIITAFDYRIFMVGGFTFGGFILFYYLALIVASGFVNLKRTVKVITSVSMAVVCLVGTVAISVYEKNRTYAFVLGSHSISSTFVSSKNENFLIISDALDRFNYNRLLRISAERGGTLDGVIVLSGAGINPQAAVSRLYGLFEIEKVYYYGKSDDKTDTTILYSFPNIGVEHYFDGVEFGANSLSFAFTLGGMAVEIITDKGKSIVFSAFNGKKVKYSSIKEEYNLAVYFDEIENVGATVDAKTEISYRNNLFYKDAESRGNTRVLLA